MVSQFQGIEANLDCKIILGLVLTMSINLTEEDHAVQSIIISYFSIGRALRTEAHRPETPGPGQYYNYGDQRYKFAYTK